MDVYEAIRKRYSCRSYEDRPIDEDKLRRVLEAGRLAPSGRNLQNWKFIVARDPEVRRKLVAASEQDWMAEVPVIVAVVSTEPERVMFCEVPAGAVDCAIPIDHMTLAATAEGLGSCWIGHFKQQEVKDALGVADSAQVIEMLTLGYPADSRCGEKDRKPFDDVVSFDRFA
jgi:nitroreductase